MPEADTRGNRVDRPDGGISHDFNELRLARALAPRMPLPSTGNWLQRQNLEPIWNREIYMFDGKNNRLLDSFSFRMVLTAAVFAAWSAAGYILLSMV